MVQSEGYGGAVNGVDEGVVDEVVVDEGVVDEGVVEDVVEDGWSR